jgi:hypothetical protein
LLALPFEGGAGPSHAAVELLFDASDAADYLPEGTKLDRVLYGLQYLRDGRPGDMPWEDLPADEDRQHSVAADLANRLIDANLLDPARLEEALERDGLSLVGDRLAEARARDDPADRLAAHVLGLFGDRPELRVARRHYEQAQRAFDRNDWEAANAQFRSSFDATYDTLAHARGCPRSRRGGSARMWLQNNGRIEEDEADLMRAFATFAGRAGSHAGLSGATDAQLRRHMATALIAFGVAKLE